MPHGAIMPPAFCPVHYLSKFKHFNILLDLFSRLDGAQNRGSFCGGAKKHAADDALCYCYSPLNVADKTGLFEDTRVLRRPGWW